MNKRIKQLAEQAFDKANNGTISDIKIPKEFIEKFSQLIVQECAGVYWSIDDGELHTKYVQSLKKHFGIEE